MSGRKLFLDTNIVLYLLNGDETIRLRKKYHTKIPDCLIIATALYLDLPLISSDSGFKKVDELFLIQYEK
jgi:hypothetical protein